MQTFLKICFAEISLDAQKILVAQILRGLQQTPPPHPAAPAHAPRGWRGVCGWKVWAGSVGARDVFIGDGVGGMHSSFSRTSAVMSSWDVDFSSTISKSVRS